ncbi:OprO/OprP family phosphate-selective porin [Roseiconus lacunae]|uniref:OprO/OprP family phosphate-selective porin n=1 Tax=Roseiconus lacunae TaxID=2605694 RepID=UPI001F4653C8|nr:OprO/OprP family phosphate-selective porin [Roseiconus lacunae]
MTALLDLPRTYRCRKLTVAEGSLRTAILFERLFVLSNRHFLLSVLVLAFALSANAIDPIETSPATLEQLQTQLTQQAGEIEKLRQRLDDEGSCLVVRPDRADRSCTPGMIERVPLVTELPVEADCDSIDASSKFKTLDVYADYDRGFVMRPFDKTKSPYEVKLNGWIQFRHHAFSRHTETWTDNAGITRPVLNRNVFDIERARLTFRGFAVDPRLTYFLQLDGDTDGFHTVDFFDYWWAWQLTDRFQIQMGKRKVTASRQWLLGARRTRFIDRPMANDFFRPDRTVGIFGVGKFAQHGHYELMVGNGYRTANLPEAVSDNQFTFAATSFFDPLGDFGGQIVDFDCSSNALLRIGHSMVYSPQASNESGIPLDESDFLRLTDGTRLTQTGALAPGVTVSEFDLWLYGIDLAWKHRGWSATSEVFIRWIESLHSDGALPVDGTIQNGCYVEGGKFLVAQTLDVNLRFSYVEGDFGNGSECAAGFNWYPLSKPTVKFSFDFTQLDGSPLQNRTSDILVGDDGTLFRTQFQAEF